MKNPENCFDIHEHLFEYAIFKYSDGFRYFERDDGFIHVDKDLWSRLDAAKLFLPEGYKIVRVN